MAASPQAKNTKNEGGDAPNTVADSLVLQPGWVLKNNPSAGKLYRELLEKPPGGAVGIAAARQPLSHTPVEQVYKQKNISSNNTDGNQKRNCNVPAPEPGALSVEPGDKHDVTCDECLRDCTSASWTNTNRGTMGQSGWWHPTTVTYAPRDMVQHCGRKRLGSILAMTR